MQRDCLLANAAGVFQQPQLIDELITFVLMLSAERIGVRAFLDLGALKRKRSKARSGDETGLVNFRPLGTVEPLLVTAELHVALGHRHAFD